MRCSDCFNPYCEHLKTPKAFRIIHGSSVDRSCSPNRKSVVDCHVVEHPYQLKPMFQYLTVYDFFKFGSRSHLYETTTMGGPDELFDYCPIYQNFLWDYGRNGLNKLSKCDNVKNNNKHYETDAYWHEIYGEKSKCFDYAEPWMSMECGFRKQPLQKKMYGACYKYMCYKNMLYIGVKRETFVQYYQCAKKGQEILIYRWIYHIGIITGRIVCPDCSEFCNDCVSKNFTSLEEFKKFEENIGDDPIDPCSKKNEGSIESNEATIYSNIKLYCSSTTHLNFFYSLVLLLIMLL